MNGEYIYSKLRKINDSNPRQIWGCGQWLVALNLRTTRKKIKAQMDAAMFQALESAALIVEASAKALAPVGDSGELRDKIDHNVTDTSNGPIVTIGSPLDYAPYVEYGTGEFAENGKGKKGGWGYTDEEGIEHWTHGQKPQPFLRPAFRRNKKNIESIIGKEFSTTFGTKKSSE